MEYEDEAGLEPMAVAGWLRSNGYKFTGKIDEQCAVYARLVSSPFGNPLLCELLLPSSRDIPDFGWRMMQLIAEFAKFERYSPDDVLVDLTRATEVFNSTRSANGLAS